MSEVSMDITAASPGKNPAPEDVYDANLVRTMSNDAIVRHLVPRIRENVPVYYPGMGARAVTVTGKAWGGQETARTFRFVVRSQNKENDKVIFVKLCPIFERINPSLVEFETLQLLYERMPSVQSNCHVSRPLDFYPELNAYAMESVGTKSFKPFLLRNNSIFRNNGSLSTMFSAVSGCADWLRIFHALTKSDLTRTFDSRAFINSMNEDYDHRSFRNYRFKPETIEALDAAIDGLASIDGKYELPCAAWHWDFTPGHVYLDNGRISVIDILGAPDVPIYEDVGRFLAAMSMINNFPLYPFFDHRRADAELCNRFVGSYFKNSSLDLEAFTLFVNIYKLKYLIFWFCGQNYRVSSKVHPRAAELFANLRLVRLFEPSLSRVAGEISRKLKNLG